MMAACSLAVRGGASVAFAAEDALYAPKFTFKESTRSRSRQAAGQEGATSRGIPWHTDRSQHRVAVQCHVHTGWWEVVGCTLCRGWHQGRPCDFPGSLVCCILLMCATYHVRQARPLRSGRLQGAQLVSDQLCYGELCTVPFCTHPIGLPAELSDSAAPCKAS